MIATNYQLNFAQHQADEMYKVTSELRECSEKRFNETVDEIAETYRQWLWNRIKDDREWRKENSENT